MVMRGRLLLVFVNVNVIPNFNKEMYIPLKPIAKEDTLRR